jgi:hypothetical protein
VALNTIVFRATEKFFTISAYFYRLGDSGVPRAHYGVAAIPVRAEGRRCDHRNDRGDMTRSIDGRQQSGAAASLR